MTKIRIYPTNLDSPVRDPQTHEPLDAKEGKEVDEEDRFWLRRLRDGAVSKEPTKAEAKEHGVIPEKADQAEQHELATALPEKE